MTGKYATGGNAPSPIQELRVLDLFAGLEGWSAPWREHGHKVISIDFDPRFAVTIHADLLMFDPDSLPWRPDVILASPPCEGFTVMNIGKNWTGPTDDPPHHPKTDSARMALALVEATRRIISACDPAFFIIENPRAKLRKLPVVADLERRTVTYCHYGLTSMKPTDLWGRFPPSLTLAEPCKNGDPCHVSAPRGSRTPGSIQGITGPNAAAERAKVPEALSLAVCLAAEADLSEGGGRSARNYTPAPQQAGTYEWPTTQVIARDIVTAFGDALDLLATQTEGETP